MGFCPSCGAKNADDSRFCEGCGGPLQTAAPQPAVPAPPVVPTSQYAAQAQQAVGQATDAVKGAMKGKKRNLIIAGVIAVVAVIFLLASCMPLSKGDYRDKLEDYLEDYSDAQSDIGSAMSEAYSKASDDDLDKDELKEINSDINDAQKEGKKAAKAIMGLNRPSQFKDEHADLKVYLKYEIRYIELVDKWQRMVKADMDDEDMDDVNDDFQELVEDKIDEDDVSDAYEDYAKALEDMKIKGYYSGDEGE